MKSKRPTLTLWHHQWPIFKFSHPPFCLSSDSLVKVRAQVMTRDESTEGWLPAAGGGLANVSIRKRPRMPDVGGHEYIIYGQRISDQTVIALNSPSRLHSYRLNSHPLTLFRSSSVASSTVISNIIKWCLHFITGVLASNAMVSHFKQQLMQELLIKESSKLTMILLMVSLTNFDFSLSLFYSTYRILYLH